MTLHSNQLRIGPRLYNLALLKHEYHITVLDSLDPMCDTDDGPAMHHRIK